MITFYGGDNKLFSFYGSKPIFNPNDRTDQIFTLNMNKKRKKETQSSWTPAGKQFYHGVAQPNSNSEDQMRCLFDDN